MTRLKWLLLSVLALGVVLTAQTPLTNLMELRGRTDANGYLITTSGAYTAPDSPLTAMANLRARTDANGYLIVTLAASPSLFGDGTSGAPSIAFASEPTLGIWRSSAGAITLQGGMSTTGNMQIAAAGFLGFTNRSQFTSPADGLMNITKNTGTVLGYQINPGTAAPTATTCGTGTVTAHSTNMAGQITATGATTCTVTFGAPAWSFAPFCSVTDVTTAAALRISTSATTSIIVTGLTSGDVFNWVCGGGAI